jgi:hypothetical protein
LDFEPAIYRRLLAFTAAVTLFMFLMLFVGHVVAEWVQAGWNNWSRS